VLSKYAILSTAYCLLLIAPFSQAQQPVSFGVIDERVKWIEPVAPETLAYTLTKDYSTEKEKLRSIFSWITYHIAYRVKRNTGNTRPGNLQSRTLVPDTSKWISGNDFMAITVLQNKSAVCDGYARLFKTLCDYAGLRSAVITGFAKGDLSRQLKFRCNHTWNAVYIDSAWRLMDVTWASGYTSYSGDEFYKRLDETYFMAAPENFIRDHFPDDLRWTLMEQPPPPHEFNNAPYKHKSFSKYSISRFSPGNGIIEASPGDTVTLVLETSNPVADKAISADTITSFDSALEKIAPSIALLEPSLVQKNQLVYHFCVQENAVQWLQLVYNHDPVLRYRLKIRPPKQRFALLSSAPPLSAQP
jgi:Transglutaminase-like superfamily